MRTKTTHVERCYQPFAIRPAQMNRNNVLTRRSRDDRTLTIGVSHPCGRRHSFGSPEIRGRRSRGMQPSFGEGPVTPFMS